MAIPKATKVTIIAQMADVTISLREELAQCQKELSKCKKELSKCKKELHAANWAVKQAKEDLEGWRRTDVN